MDRTSLNLVAIFIAGSGLFASLTKFGVPELNMSFFGVNPFAIKRDIVNGVITWLFTGLTLLGFLIRVVVEILGDKVPSRSHSRGFYLRLSLIGVLIMAGVVPALAPVGHAVAKKKWFPEVVENQTESFRQAEFIVEHNGLSNDQLALGDRLADIEGKRRQNYETTDKRLSQIEQLLELPIRGGDLKTRREALKPYFRNSGK